MRVVRFADGSFALTAKSSGGGSGTISPVIVAEDAPDENAGRAAARRANYNPRGVRSPRGSVGPKTITTGGGGPGSGAGAGAGAGGGGGGGGGSSTISPEATPPPPVIDPTLITEATPPVVKTGSGALAPIVGVIGGYKIAGPLGAAIGGAIGYFFGKK